MHIHLLSLLTLACALGAQGPAQLVGLTDTTPVVLQLDTTNCNLSRCQAAGFPRVGNPRWGGTAYSNTDRGTWISDGLMIAEVDADNQCRYLCPPQPMPNTAAGNEVTGLAYSELLGRLFVTDMSGVIRWYRISNCQLSLDARCAIPIGPTDALTGCATDDINGLIYYSIVSSGQPGGTVLVAKQSDPCNYFCKLPVQACGGNPLNELTGLAFDACKQVLWVTDGKTVVAGRVDTTQCTFTEFQCCTNGSGEALQGLCMKPGRESSVGTSCTSPACPACPTMSHVLTGDPVVGSPFGANLINAPAQARAVLVLNVGPCTLPGIVIGLFCGPLLVPLAPAPFVTPLLPTNGGAGCSGAINLSFSLPNNPTLCGAVVSTQYLGVCAPTGTFVSNCLSWQIGSP